MPHPFTPGPWAAGPSNTGLRVWADEQFIVAKCDISPHLREITKRANAILIAAAPELLEALQEAIAVIERIKPPEYGNGTIVRGHAAISKALGVA